MAKRNDPEPGPGKPGPRKDMRRGLRRTLWRLIARPLRWAGYALAVAVVWVAAYRVIDPPGGYYMAREWIRLGQVERDWRDLAEMTPDLPRAVMAAEDANFCLHWGFDLEAIEKALAERADGGRMRGASTITQQVAKNLFLWHGRSWVRKGLEAGFTVLIEALWPKRRIIEVYLNVAEFDDGIFGAQAAARRYFTADASGLSLGQAARLAAVLPDPKDRNAAANTDFMARRSAAIAAGARTLEVDGRAKCLE